jgi:hypothetical protein
MTYAQFKQYLQRNGKLEIGDKLPKHIEIVAMSTTQKSGIVRLLGVGKFYFVCDYCTPANVELKFVGR